MGIFINVLLIYSFRNQRRLIITTARKDFYEMDDKVSAEKIKWTDEPPAESSASPQHHEPQCKVNTTQGNLYNRLHLSFTLSRWKPHWVYAFNYYQWAGWSLQLTFTVHKQVLEHYFFIAYCENKLEDRFCRPKRHAKRYFRHKLERRQKL